MDLTGPSSADKNARAARDASAVDGARGGLEAPVAGTPFLAADVGGTHARVGRVQVDRAGRVEVLEYRVYACAAYPSLAAILREFAAATATRADHAVVAIAGRLAGDRLVNSNLAWPVSLQQTRHAAGVAHLALINDFEAVAHAVPHLDPAAMTRLCGPVHALQETAPALVLGPGTGLGAALHLPGPPPQVLASEAGHAALAAGSPRELALLGELLQRWPHVDNERVLSGPGLVNAYLALCRLDGVDPCLHAPAAITAAALDGSDRLAVETLSLFCGLLGSLAGDLAVTFGAGQVYLAGGVLANLGSFLLDSRFAERFTNKGVFAEALEQVPVWLLGHGQAGQVGLVGAAAWYAAQRTVR